MTRKPSKKSTTSTTPAPEEEAPAAEEPQAADAEPTPETGGGNGGDEEGAPPLVINGQYIKDLSFEAPNAPAIFQQLQGTQPEITVNIDVRAQPIQGPVFEVVLSIHAECKVGETIGFILELAYGGVFTISVPPVNVQPFLLIECPRLLFPFARNIVADASRDGGFPPLMLGQVDFVGMYQEQLERPVAAATANADTEAN